MAENNAFVVIGAGLIGICTALELTHRGCKVTLIDSGKPGRGASFGNAGFIASELVDPLSTPDTIRKAMPMLVNPHGALSIPLRNLHRSLPWMVRFAFSARSQAVARGRDALAQLLTTAVPAWQALLDRERLSNHLHRSHYMRVWERAQGKAAALAERNFYNDWGIEAQFAEREQVSALEPALDGQISHAVLLPNAHRLSDPYQVSQLLFKRFQERGGQFLQGHVESLRPNEHGVQLAVSGSKQLFDKAIICTGAHSSELLRSLNVTVPLMAERGYHLNLPSVKNLITGPICSAERNVFISPLQDGLRIVGFSELGGVTLPENPARYETLKHHLGALLPQTKPHLEQASRWMGMRPTLPDSLPVIDSLPHAPCIGFAFGHQHAGITLAATTSQLIADRMTKGVDAMNMTPFRINRF
ncbi:NAD(P)/FAD-dependent oxidoreductase [Pseudomonas promysalinigenes]|uniref:FAD-binding oxidoreductase n=1 Tax=Pseudomonas promysalinigenes TaxID=485898 RepID=A0ABY6AMK2_9PSED|nr:FAD-dependent oxidoreductase [Pseudomonas promysalinigenes]UXH38785.1 FAD-binding oxidoreductase [Pseudomonas promysalinigenes]